jgi:hypothetical protein
VRKLKQKKKVAKRENKQEIEKINAKKAKFK